MSENLEAKITQHLRRVRQQEAVRFNQVSSSAEPQKAQAGSRWVELGKSIPIIHGAKLPSLVQQKRERMDFAETTTETRSPAVAAARSPQQRETRTKQAAQEVTNSLELPRGQEFRTLSPPRRDSAMVSRSTDFGFTMTRRGPQGLTLIPPLRERYGPNVRVSSNLGENEVGGIVRQVIVNKVDHRHFDPRFSSAEARENLKD